MSLSSVLVTGGCGFLGSRIVEHIRQQYPTCYIAVFDTNRPDEQKTQVADDYLQGNITDHDAVRLVFAGQQKAPFQAVIHVANLLPPLGERYSRRLDALIFRTNVEGTRHLLQAAKDAGVAAFVYTSSICAVTDDFTRTYANIDERWPLLERGRGSSYGESKAAAEILVQRASNSSFRTCSLRPAVIFGEGDHMLVPNIVNCIRHKNESPYRLGDGTNLWDTVYVGNVADAHLLAVENLLSKTPTAAGEAFFIQNNEPVSCRDFMLQIWKEYNGHVPSFEIEIPPTLAWSAGLLAEVYAWLTGSPATISRGSVMDATATRYASGEKARRILGYEPRVGLEEGLHRSCKVSHRKLPLRCRDSHIDGIQWLYEHVRD